MKSLLGKTFDRWKVLAYAGKASTCKTAQTLWLCLCSCGTEKCVQYGSLVGGTSRSCGCYRAEATGNRFRKVGKKFTARNRSSKPQKKRAYKMARILKSKLPPR